jgi:hypothetical protein
MGQTEYIDISWDELDDEPDFFDEIDSLKKTWIPSRVGDRFSIVGFGYGSGRVVYEILRIEEEGWEHSNNICFIIAGSVPDQNGKYDMVGFTSTLALRNQMLRGAVVHRGRNDECKWDDPYNSYYR